MSSSTFSYIQIQGNVSSSNTKTGNGVTMGMYNSESNLNYEMTRIAMTNGYPNSNILGFGDLLFFTKAGVSSEFKEAMRITYDRNIGIGTKTPTEKLSIYDGNIQILGSNTGLIIQDTSNINSTLLNNDGLSYKNSNYYISYINNSNQIIKTIEFDSNLNTKIYNNLSVDSNIYTNNLSVFGITNLNSNLIVTGTTNINSNLTVNGISTLNNNLLVNGSTTLNSVTSSNLVVKGSATVSNLTVAGMFSLCNLEMNNFIATGNTFLSGITTINSNLIVNGSTTLSSLASSNLTVSGTSVLSGITTLNNNLLVNGSTTVNSLVSSNLTVSGTTVLSGAAILNSNLSVNGLTTLNNALGVSGLSTLNTVNAGNTTLSNLTAGATTLNSTLGVIGVSTLGILNSGAHTITGILTVSGATILNNTLGVTGISTLGTLNAAATTVSSTLGVTGVTTLTTLTAGATTLNSTLAVTGISTLGTLNAATTTVSSTLGVTGATTLTTLTAGATTLNSTLGVTGISTLGTLNAGATTVSSTLGVTGISTLGTLNAGATTVSSTLGVTGISTLGTLNAGATTVSSTLGVTGISTLGALNAGATTVSSTLGVTGATTLNSTLGVTGISTFNNNVSIAATRTLNVTSGATTLGGTLNVTGVTTLNSYNDLNNITRPSYPATNAMRLYYNNNNGFLESLSINNTSNILTTYNPTSNVGDITVHNGITQTALPVGTINQILYSDPNIPNKLGWKDISDDTQAIDLTATRYYDSYNSAQTILNNTTYTDISFDSDRFKGYDYFSITNDIEITFTYTGTYNIFITVGTVSITTGTFAINRFKVQKSTQGGAYVDVTAAICFTNTDIVNTTSLSNGTIVYIEDAIAGDKIKVCGIIFSGRTASTIALAPNQCEIIVSKINIDDINDSSTYIDSYINTTKALTVNTYVDMNFDINRYSNSYTHTPGTAIFTVSSTGIYLIICKINSIGTTKAFTTSQLLSNVSGSFVVIPGSICHTYHNDATNNECSGAIIVIVSLNAGNSIKLQSQCNVNTMSLQPGTSMYIACLKSSTNNQTNVKFFNAYNTTSRSLATANVYVDITMQNTNADDSIYSFTNNTAPITLNETGRYLIIHRTSVNNAGTATTRQDSIQSRLVIDKGAGFVDVPSTNVSCFVGGNINFKATSACFCTVYITSGSIIKLQSAKVSTQTSIITTISNGSSISIIKLDNPRTLKNIPPVILNYGTYFEYAINKASSSTTSTVYQQKLLLSTKQIPTGIYHIDISYQVAPIANTKDLSVRVVVDDVNVIHEQVIAYAATLTLVTTDFENVRLDAGFHDISLEFRTVTGASSGIYNTKLAIYRVQ